MYLVPFISLSMIVLYLIFAVVLGIVASNATGDSVMGWLGMFLLQLMLPSIPPVAVMVWHGVRLRRRKRSKKERVNEPTLTGETFLLTLTMLFLFMAAGPVFAVLIGASKEVWGQMQSAMWLVLLAALFFWCFRVVKRRRQSQQPEKSPWLLVTGVLGFLFATVPLAQAGNELWLTGTADVGRALVQMVPYVLIFAVVYLGKRRDRHAN